MRQPPWKTSTAAPGLGDRLSALLGRPAVRVGLNLAAIGAVAGALLWPVEPPPDPELAQLRADNGALLASNQQLRDEVSELGYRNEILHWQLRYAEQSLRLADRDPSEPAPRAPATRAGGAPTTAAAAASSPVHRVVITPIEAAPAPPEASRVEAPLLLDDEDEPRFSLRPDARASLQQRALVDWQGVVAEAAAGECGRSLATAGSAKCRDEVSRALWPYASAAVRCITSGNAAAVYVAKATLDALPTHSVPLQRGAVILCDGALTNQAAPAL